VCNPNVTYQAGGANTGGFLGDFIPQQTSKNASAVFPLKKIGHLQKKWSVYGGVLRKQLMEAFFWGVIL
jgi:hypothetical protein